jgi:hypothetical protein
LGVGKESEEESGAEVDKDVEEIGRGNGESDGETCAGVEEVLSVSIILGDKEV